MIDDTRHERRMREGQRGCKMARVRHKRLDEQERRHEREE